MLRPNNLKCGGKKKKQEGGKIDMSQFYNQPVSSPFKSEPQQGYNNRIEEGIAKGILDIERQEGDSLLDSYNAVNEKKTPATPKHWDQSLGIGMMALRGLTSEIAGRVARGRQNQYDYMQQSALGQMNPMPASDYQPNPYSLYAKYGGNLKSYQMGGMPFNGPIRKMKNVTINNYGNQPMLQSPMDNLTAMVGTENPDFMSMLQGMRSMKYGGLQHVNYFGPPFSNGAEMKMGDEDKMDVKATHSVMSKLLRGFKKGGLTPNKAREILHDGTAQGHPLTDKQRRFFGAKSKGHTNYRDK